MTSNRISSLPKVGATHTAARALEAGTAISTALLLIRVGSQYDGERAQLREQAAELDGRRARSGARVLAKLGDSVTIDAGGMRRSPNTR
ncbi:hypothetical protein GCM10027269_04740 [Kribbella endophytica]